MKLERAQLRPTIMAELEGYGKGRLKLSEVLNEPELPITKKGFL